MRSCPEVVNGQRQNLPSPCERKVFPFLLHSLPEPCFHIGTLFPGILDHVKQNQTQFRINRLKLGGVCLPSSSRSGLRVIVGFNRSSHSSKSLSPDAMHMFWITKGFQAKISSTLGHGGTVTFSSSFLEIREGDLFSSSFNSSLVHCIRS